MNSLVVHYKELALKGKNRPWFVQHLVRNLRTALHGTDVRAVRSLMGRLDIELGPAASGSATDAGSAPLQEIRDRVRRVFGIANFSCAGRAPHDFPILA